tara:strand:+ start:153 stop:731 length:579 start_codon:yes stop_codon:yes gene_type:complete
MKKYIITVLFFGCIIGQFRTGTISAGSLFHYSAYSENDGNTNGDNHIIGTTSLKSSYFSAKPGMNYFILPFLSIDATIEYTKMQNVDDGNGSELNGLGVGASYYFNQNIYIGGGTFQYTSSSNNNDDETKTKTSYTNIYGGYLIPLNSYVFIDLNCNYLTGLTQEYSNPFSNSSIGIDDTIFAFNVGIKAFF